ncbi:hypothetical protein EVC45_39460 [Paraburkholderia sp. UYCP14C]|uniref:hypothetical protein n=1 Tax=Paraburkholderia sp. UYCP14C TaxID=2511130 RepID=UPI0010219C11|nr:hypothetical protein [Paraburkholderia sp. UYCP14C]RZF24300.1 hypothetical protein EVC45_39460 [Paraburkholderia sp. UYCP14C]
MVSLTEMARSTSADQDISLSGYHHGRRHVDRDRQQALLALHRVCDELVAEQSVMDNQILVS